ncbi:MAG TPA: cation transporter [Candidatus Hydrogenedentes bacterium]|nr:cation transporter [Candidatus Hydrogenedentota bacterium]
MDSVVCDSLRRFPEADAHHRAIDDLLWFGLKIFLFLAVFEIGAGALEHSLLILASGFYSAASLAYVAGLLLAHHESVKPADERYPYGYGNRAAVFQLVSLCLLGVGGVYLLFLILESHGAALGYVGLGTFLSAPLSLAIAFWASRTCERNARDIEAQEAASLKLVLKGAVVVSAMAFAALACARIFAGNRLAAWAAALVVVTTLCFFVRGFYETFRVVTDRSAVGDSFGHVSRLAQRAAREAEIVDVSTRSIGQLTHVEVRAAFPFHVTVAEANAIERDIETVLRRKLPKVGQVAIHWE